MTRLYVVEILKDNIQFLTRSLQPAKCTDKKGNVALELAIGKVCHLHRQGGQRTSQSRDFGYIGHTHLVTKTPSSGKKINSFAEHTQHS